MRQLVINKGKKVGDITNQESESLEKYLVEINRIRLLTAEEEVYFAKKIKQGDQSALKKLIEANLRFVVSVAKKYQNNGLALSDLISEGNLGLIKAAKRFDETRGFKFISYAVWWIRQSILLALSEHAKIVRLPLNVTGFINKIQRAFARLEQEFEREPLPEEIAEILEILPNEVETALEIKAKSISIDAPIEFGLDYDDGELFSERLTNQGKDNNPENELEKECFEKEIAVSLGILTERQADVICLYFGIGFEYKMTLEDIGKKFGLTRERVRQIIDKALTRLRGKKQIIKKLKP